MKGSEFCRLAIKMLKEEMDKAESFCDYLNSVTDEKNVRMDEYRETKNRYGAVGAIYNMIFLCYKHRNQLYDTYYLLLPYYELVKKNDSFIELYNKMSDEEKSDFALYYGAIAYAKTLTKEKEKALEGAEGSERAKLVSYIKGYSFAMECIESAYRRAKGIALTPVEIEKALVDIATAMYDDCTERIERLPENTKTEKKAICIEQGMYSMGPRAAIRYYTNGSREHAIRIKSIQFTSILQDFPEVLRAFENADDSEKQKLTAALHGEVWLMGQYQRENLRQLEMAKESGDVKAIFELNIKVKAINALLSAWKSWRVRNGIYADLL